MKLKYYLRGLGMGILFATLIMTVSSVVHNNNLSEETIIKEARKLGMIMPEEEESDGGLWGKKEDVVDTENSEVAEEVIIGTEIENNTEPENAEVNSESETVVPETTQSGNVTLIEISIYPGDAARQVAERLYTNGLVDDSESFRLFLGQSGYANVLSVGEYYIPVGATYEEILNILIHK